MRFLGLSTEDQPDDNVGSHEAFKAAKETETQRGIKPLDQNIWSGTILQHGSVGERKDAAQVDRSALFTTQIRATSKEDV